ncbi:NAD-dependent protein deacetylase [subsurface metagenome]
MELKKRIELCSEWMAGSEKLVIFTGAGISTDSGLPDYRGPDGVWTRRDRGLPPPPIKTSLSKIRPNPGHMAIVELQNIGKLWFLISQNVDNLHLKSGIRSEMLAELHGNSAIMKCMRCDRRFSKQALRWDEAKWGKGYRGSNPVRGQPKCPCGGRIISSIINFGDPMPEKEMRAAVQHSESCDLFIAAGSSLAVSPANDIPLYAMRKGARLIIINRGQTPLDSAAALLFREGISEVLPVMVEKVKRLLR